MFKARHRLILTSLICPFRVIVLAIPKNPFGALFPPSPPPPPFPPSPSPPPPILSLFQFGLSELPPSISPFASFTVSSFLFSSFFFADFPTNQVKLTYPLSFSFSVIHLATCSIISLFAPFFLLCPISFVYSPNTSPHRSDLYILTPLCTISRTPPPN